MVGGELWGGCGGGVWRGLEEGEHERDGGERRRYGRAGEKRRKGEDRVKRDRKGDGESGKGAEDRLE